MTGPISTIQSENSDQKLFRNMAEILFIRFRLSLIDNPKMGTGFELTTINQTSKWSFLCFRVSGHFPSTGILELLCVDNFWTEVRFRVNLF